VRSPLGGEAGSAHGPGRGAAERGPLAPAAGPAALRALAALVSGAAFVAAFPPLDLGGLAWVALVPLLWAVRGRAPREAFWLGYLWGAVGLGGVLWWLTAFGPGAWALAALFTGIFPALALCTSAALAEGPGRRLGVLLVPAVWTAVEFLRSHGPLAFPWALLGESQHRALVVAQIASVTGVYGLSFLVALVNAALSRLALGRRALGPVALAAAALAAAAVWGHAALRAPAGGAGPASGTFVAAVVQPEYAARFAWDARRAARDLVTLGRLTHEAARRGASLVVWPETASPTDIAGDPATLALIRAWVRGDRVSLIASALEGGRTNSAFSFAPDGVLAGRYDKMRLVPFAEFGERAGRGPAVLPTPLGPVGIAICFESTFPEIARQSVAAGAGVLAVITNDAWFGGGAAALQHAAIAPFRAIEEGRYLLRAANGGLSEIIDPRGRVLASLPPGVRGVLVGRVAAREALTPYARFGDLFGWGVVWVVAALLLLRARATAAEELRDPALRRLLAVSLVPLSALGAAAALSAAGVPDPAIGGAAVPLPVLAVLASLLLLARGVPARDLGLTAAGFAPAALAGLAAVAAFTLLAVRGAAAYSPAPALTPPPGGWAMGGAVQVLVVGLALEGWLRGLVFAAAAAWRGRAPAVLWAALLGAAAALPRGPEAMVWSLLSGLAFGLIRARWAQVPALALAHGTGAVLLGFLISSW
jgi:apolipoprotein N-acyltransferase